MLQISEIVKKTEEMFDLFNEHFYNMELTRPAITVSRTAGAAHTAGAASTKSGMPTRRNTERSISAPSILTAP